jgi:hypothetical protein
MVSEIPIFLHSLFGSIEQHGSKHKRRLLGEREREREREREIYACVYRERQHKTSVYTYLTYLYTT